MAASIQLQSCTLQIQRIIGATESGRDRIQSLSFDGISDEASAATLLGVKGAVAGVISTPIANVFRNDKNLVNPGE